MAYLPLANLLHHKLRSVLSAAGIGIGIFMLLTLTGLSRGSLGEVADRWEAVNAELIVYPRDWGENITTLTGIGLSDRYAEKLRAWDPNLVRDVVPVFLWQMRIGGQGHLAAGVDAAQWPALVGGRKLSAGRPCDPGGEFAAWLEKKLLTPSDDPNTVLDISPAELEARGGMELVIDDRLARNGHLHAGDVVEAANHRWHIVGVVPAGGMTRVYMPRRTAQFLFGSGSIGKSTLLFVKLSAGAEPAKVATQLHLATGQEVVQVSQYRQMLQQKLGIMYVYVDAVNAIALVISFLFIMVTLYTMVLQRTREIAILRSLGASRWYVLRGVLAEAMLLAGAGAGAGIALSFPSGWLIQTFSLYAVTITLPWVGIALAAAAAGALLAGLYPAWRATKVDVVQALTLE